MKEITSLDCRVVEEDSADFSTVFLRCILLKVTPSIRILLAWFWFLGVGSVTILSRLCLATLTAIFPHLPMKDEMFI